MSTYPFSYEIRMVSGVERVYVHHKSEVTELINAEIKAGNSAYRTALICECDDRQNVRVNSAVVLSPDGQVLKYIIRCNACARKEEDYGTL